MSGANSMTDEETKADMLVVAQGRRAVYDFLARLFLTPIPTPGHDYTDMFLRAFDDYACVSDLDDFHAGMRSLQDFKGRAAGGDLEEVQRQLAVDRTRLCRGIVKDAALMPPYEAPYLMPEKETERLLALVRFYRKTGLAVSAGQAERMDFIGVELAFMGELCAKEHAALAAGNTDEYEAVLAWEKEFLQDHLLPWVVDYCGAMIAHAETDFFRGFGSLMRAFLTEERELCEQA
jgi:putative dimethyl sulfoxide reductase chaperone